MGKYREGKVKVGAVKNVQVGFERFAPGVDHVFLRFELSEDIPLFEQNGRGKPIGTTRVLVISSEGVPPKDHKYSMSEGYWGQYLLADRLVTGEELERWVKQLNHPVRLFSLHLSEAQVSRILLRGIRRSESSSFQSAYQLFANNCSTSALSLIDEETGFKATGWDPFHLTELEEALPIAGPFGTARELRIRGLIDWREPGIDLFPRAEAHP